MAKSCKEAAAEFTVLEFHDGLYILEPGCLIAYSLSAFLDAGIDILSITRQEILRFLWHGSGA